MNPRKTSTLAATLHGFFTDYLPRQRALSPHTLHSYRDSLKLLLQFVAGKKGDPSQITLEDLTVERVATFLQYLETGRRNQSSSRNVRLSAIHSFFRYVGAQCPEHLAQVQRILSVPFKRSATREIQHLSFDEIQAVLGAIDRSTGSGRRDLALLSLMFNTGARVSEIAGLQTADLRLAPPPSIVLRGKGRKERTCPLWPETAHLLQKVFEERGVAPRPSGALFLNHRGQPVTRFGIRLILRKHLREAAKRAPSLKHKRLHPHSVRHYLPFLTMSGTSTPAQYFRQMREVAHDIVLTPSISPMQGKGVHREVYYRLPSSSFAGAGRPSRVTYRAVCEVTE